MWNILTLTIKEISDRTAFLPFMLNRYHTSCTKYYILAKVLIVLSKKKNQIRISCNNAHVHSMSLSTTKFHGILLSGFRGVGNWETVSVVYFSKFKMGGIFFTYAHLHIMYFLTRQFYELLLGGFRGVALTSKKKGLTNWPTDGRVKYIIPSFVKGIKIIPLSYKWFFGNVL